MHFSEEVLRGIAIYNSKRGLTRQECKDEMVSILGHKAPSAATVMKWYKDVSSNEKEKSCGGISEISGDDLIKAEEVLQYSLTKLAAGEGPNYKLSKIISASEKIVSGTLYRYKAELIDDKNDVKLCGLQIWSQPWLKKGIQVTFEFEGEEKIVKRHSPSKTKST